MKEITINDVLRASSVQRWTVVKTLISQNMAEHSFNVTMMAWKIAMLAGMNPDNMIKYALTHDLEEIWSGDIPQSYKVRAVKNGHDLNIINSNIKTPMMKKVDLSNTELMIVKAADMLDAYQFLKQYYVGDHAVEVLGILCEDLQNFIDDMPEGRVKDVVASAKAQFDMPSYDIR